MQVQTILLQASGGRGPERQVACTDLILTRETVHTEERDQVQEDTEGRMYTKPREISDNNLGRDTKTEGEEGGAADASKCWKSWLPEQTKGGGVEDDIGLGTRRASLGTKLGTNMLVANEGEKISRSGERN